MAQFEIFLSHEDKLDFNKYLFNYNIKIIANKTYKNKRDIKYLSIKDLQNKKFINSYFIYLNCKIEELHISGDDVFFIMTDSIPQSLYFSNCSSKFKNDNEIIGLSSISYSANYIDYENYMKYKIDDELLDFYKSLVKFLKQNTKIAFFNSNNKIIKRHVGEKAVKSIKDKKAKLLWGGDKEFNLF